MPEALFKTKAVKIDTLGEYLASVRNQLNLDIKTVSLMTQIKPSYLELLEAGDYQSLPADVYVRGFLKSLAVNYRIKESVLVDQYEKEIGIGIIPMTKPEVSKEQKFSLTPRKIVIGTSILLALLAIVYVGKQIRSVLAPPYLVVNEPADDMNVQGNSVVVAGIGEVGSEVFINNQPVLIDASGHFTENLILSSGLNVVEISERNKFGKVSKIVRKITSENTVATQIPQSAVNLVINIGPGSAWVSMEADGVVVQKGTMLAGSTKTVSAKNEIILTSADAGSTEVTYNGKNLGKLGRAGEVIRNVQFSSSSQ